MNILHSEIEEIVKNKRVFGKELSNLPETRISQKVGDFVPD
jgi:hypothetical protein